MRFTAALVVGASAFLASTGSASAKGDAKAETLRKGEKANGNKNLEVPAEDEEYWGRFLQTIPSVPTPSPTPAPTPNCVIEVDLTCTDADDKDVECKEIPTGGEGPCEVDMEYCYTVSNGGTDPESVTKLIVTQNGVTRDITPSNPTVVIQPGEEVTICEVMKDVDVCSGINYETCVEVEAMPPSEEPCDDKKCYELPTGLVTPSPTPAPTPDCIVVVDLTCTTDDTDKTECKDIPTGGEGGAPCEVDMEYCYTVKNDGTDPESVTKLIVTQDGVTKDITPRPPKVIQPGETATFCEIVTDVDVCSGATYETCVFVEAMPPSEVPCEDSQCYELPTSSPAPTPAPTPNCIVVVDLTCTEDGTDTECKDIPTGGEGPCEVDLEYCYTVKNDGTDPESVTKLIVTQDGVTRDITPRPARVIQPGETAEFCELVTDVDVCSGTTYETCVFVEAMPPSEVPCEDSQCYELPTGTLPPTPSPTPAPTPNCIVVVDLTCTEDGTDTECKDIPTGGEGPCEVDLEYCYTVSNDGTDPESITKLIVTQDGVTRDITPTNPPRVIQPGETTTICELVTDVDVCSGTTYETCVFVEAMPPSEVPCEDSQCYELPTSSPAPTPAPTPNCIVEVDLTCTDADDTSVECMDIPTGGEGPCVVDLEYCYTVSNDGTDPESITKLIVTQNGVTKDITPNPTIVIQPGEEERICDIVTDVNVCEGTTYETCVEVEAMPPSEEPCDDSKCYELPTSTPPPTPSPTPAPTPNCIVVVDLTCTEDGTDTECKDIPTGGEGGAPCEVDLEYCYTVTNDGTDPESITKLIVTQDGVTRDITPENPRVIQPGETAEFCELVTDVDVCSGATYETCVFVEAMPPSAVPCEDSDCYTLITTTPAPTPAPTDDCDVEVDVECTTDSPTFGGSGLCNDLIPIVTRCDNRASEMKFKYNGGDCSQSFTIQEADKFSCSDFTWTDATGESGTGPPLEGSAYLVLTSQKDVSDVYFAGTEDVGDVFSAIAESGRFEADSILTVYRSETDDTVMQVVNFHTSCSQNLFLKDRYGSAQVVEFTNEAGTFSCFLDATLAIVIDNEGQSRNTITTFTSSFTNDTGTFTDDCLDNIDSPVVPPNQSLEVGKSLILDMTTRQDYSAEVFMESTTPAGSTCQASGETSWTSGNPPINPSRV